MIDGAARAATRSPPRCGRTWSAACCGAALMAPRDQHVQETEALPEADRLEDFPHPRETHALFGHDGGRGELAQAFAGGRMHHAWLLAGRDGIGKATLAYRLARHVLARPEERDPAGQSLRWRRDRAPRGRCARSRIRACWCCAGPTTRSRSGSRQHPRGRGAAARVFLGLRRRRAAWRVVIVDAADELNVNAANALLKSLEEPPTRALFLLVTSEPSRLLPTIRSRCRRLDLAPLDAESLRRAAEAALAGAGLKPPPADKWPQLARLADGSVRAALQLATGGIELTSAWSRSSPACRIRIGRRCTRWPIAHRRTAALRNVLHLLLDRLARLVRARASGQGSPPRPPWRPA